MYKYSGYNGQVFDGVIIRVACNAFIPFDPATADYQKYLAWLAEGNQPLPADGTQEQSQ